jgi:hypothetical protein
MRVSGKEVLRRLFGFERQEVTGCDNHHKNGLIGTYAYCCCYYCYSSSHHEGVDLFRFFYVVKC